MNKGGQDELNYSGDEDDQQLQVEERHAEDKESVTSAASQVTEREIPDNDDEVPILDPIETIDKCEFWDAQRKKGSFFGYCPMYIGDKKSYNTETEELERELANVKVFFLDHGTYANTRFTTLRVGINEPILKVPDHKMKYAKAHEKIVPNSLYINLGEYNFSQTSWGQTRYHQYMDFLTLAIKACQEQHGDQHATTMFSIVGSTDLKNHGFNALKDHVPGERDRPLQTTYNRDREESNNVTTVTTDITKTLSIWGKRMRAIRIIWMGTASNDSAADWHTYSHTMHSYIFSNNFKHDPRLFTLDADYNLERVHYLNGHWHPYTAAQRLKTIITWMLKTDPTSVPHFPEVLPPSRESQVREESPQPEPSTSRLKSVVVAVNHDANKATRELESRLFENKKDEVRQRNSKDRTPDQERRYPQTSRFGFNKRRLGRGRHNNTYSGNSNTKRIRFDSQPREGKTHHDNRNPLEVDDQLMIGFPTRRKPTENLETSTGKADERPRSRSQHSRTRESSATRTHRNKD